MKKRELKKKNSLPTAEKVALLWNYLQYLGSEWREVTCSQ